MLLDVVMLSRPAVAAALAVVFVLVIAVRRLLEIRKIRRLGKRASIIHSRFFGIDETLKVFEYARKHQNRELWEMRFKEFNNHTMEVRVLGKRIIMTAEPENVKAVLATQFLDFGKGETFHQQWQAFLGDSIFTTDGKEWSASRHLIRPQFIKDRVSDLHIFERHTQRMLSLIPRDGSKIDISELFFRVTLDAATDFLLGASVDSLKYGNVEFAVAFQRIQAHMNNVSRAGPLRIFLDTKQFKQDLKVLNAFVEPFVEKVSRMRPEELKGKDESDYNFLHALAQFTRDPKMLRDQLVAILLAARDTTAGTMAWALYELAKRPDTVQRLRKEILGTVGPTAAPTYEDLKGMRFLQHVINETLRLYPAVPFNVRVALKDTSLPHGGGPYGLDPVGVPAGTLVAYSTLTMQRRVDLFGPDVAEFKPERWDHWAPKAWQYVPFNGGPRICLGQQFALTEMGYILCRLFQNFDAVEDRSTEPQIERCEVTISPGSGVWVAFRPAKNG
ncbi:cytochrome P450 52A5 [Sphaerosporella brunnea]|uniref:Cytochrome P450 52A5 n=1 Tax=Sphaerosporella brunnea TaxID=1250544 RepID=A0A5J5EPF2_9PEZI|nr:cytochrome P450 52A5 [Sphaerosporella brunnea]